MELRNRVELLAQLGNMGLLRVEQASLLEFLVGLPDTTREAILDYVCQEDPLNSRLQLLKTLAAMDTAERNQTLNALGLLRSPQKGFFDELFSNPKQTVEATGSIMKELAVTRDYFIKNLWQPFKRLTKR